MPDYGIWTDSRRFKAEESIEAAFRKRISQHSPSKNQRYHWRAPSVNHVDIRGGKTKNKIDTSENNNLLTTEIYHD